MSIATACARKAALWSEKSKGVHLKARPVDKVDCSEQGTVVLRLPHVGSIGGHDSIMSISGSHTAALIVDDGGVMERVAGSAVAGLVAIGRVARGPCTSFM